LEWDELKKLVLSLENVWNQVKEEYLRHLITNPLGQSRVFSLMALLFFWGYLSRSPSSPQGHREKANEEKRGGSR